MLDLKFNMCYNILATVNHRLVFEAKREAEKLEKNFRKSQKNNNKKL